MWDGWGGPQGTLARPHLQEVRQWPDIHVHAPHKKADHDIDFYESAILV